MAAASTKKLETLLECPICLEKVTEPRLFKCLHFYCQPCVGDMKPKTENGITGYLCPTCRKFTAKEKLRAMHFIHELLEIVEMAKQEQAQICDMCKEASAEHKCLDCKQTFCSHCKTQHNRIAILQNHRWETVEEGARAMLDKHVYCAIHPQEIVKIHCKDCKMLICLICNGTDHKQHSAETIEKALEHTLAAVKTNQEEIQKVIAQNENVLTRAAADMTHVETQYDDIEKEIERKREEAMRKLQQDSDQQKQQVVKAKTAHIEEIQQFIKTADLTVKGQKNILSLSNTTLTTAKSTSLLQTLQSGITQSLANNIMDSCIKATYQNQVNMQFKSSPAHEGNLVGSIVKRDDVVPQPLYNNVLLDEMMNRKPKFVKEAKLPNYCMKFAKIKERFYCVGYRSSDIHVYNTQLDKVHDFKPKDNGKVRSVAHVDQFLLIASETGLYHSNMDGSNAQPITRGGMVSICWSGDKGYVLDDTNGKAISITFNSVTKTFAQNKEIKLDPYDKDCNNALQLTCDFIWIGFPGKHVIRKYNHDGVLLSSHDAGDSGIGRLSSPRLCGQDAAGCLLIADRNNQRLVTLSPGGDWQCLQLSELSYPYCAMIEDNSLYVLHGRFGSKFMQYMFD